MSGKYYFGAVYLIEQGREKSIMLRDLDNMKACGFDMITIWPPANCWLASRPDEFAFGDTIWMLDRCHERGIKVLVQLIGQNQSQEYMPDCLMRPEMMVTAVNCFWANPNHPDVDRAVRRYIKEAVNALKEHPAVWGWDVFNEAHFRSEDPFTIKEYQKWLEKRYGSIENLNTRWYRRFSDFSQINPADRDVAYSVWSSVLPAVDFELFLSENLTEQCRRWVNYVKDFDSSHPVVVDGTSGQLLKSSVRGRCNDEFRTAETCDVFGGTYYPKSWGNNMTDRPWELSANYRIAASAAEKAGKSFIISELQTHTQSALTPGSEVSPGELSAWIWSGIAAGAEAFQLWRWRPFLHGYQSTGRGLTSLDGTPGKRAEAVKEMCSVIRSNEGLFATMKPERDQVRIVTSYHSRLYYDVFMKNVNVKHHEELIGWYKIFWASGIPTGFTDLDSLDERDMATKILVLPAMISLSDGQCSKLAEYVRNGGILIADARLNTVDEYGVVRAEAIPGSILGEVFGVKEIETGTPENYKFGESEIKASFMSQELEVSVSTEVIASTISGKAAVTVNTYGKGKAVYINNFAGITWNSGLIPPAIVEYFRDLSGFDIKIKKSEMVECRIHRDGERLMIYAINLAEKVSVVEFDFAKDLKFKDIVSGVLFSGGHLSLDPYKTAILLQES